jgi:hypothetical protein
MKVDHSEAMELGGAGVFFERYGDNVLPSVERHSKFGAEGCHLVVGFHDFLGEVLGSFFVDASVGAQQGFAVAKVLVREGHGCNFLPHLESLLCGLLCDVHRQQQELALEGVEQQLDASVRCVLALTAAPPNDKSFF